MTEMLKSIDPSSGRVVGEVGITPVDAIPSIVAETHRAGRAWAGIPVDERAGILAAAGERLVERAEELGTLLSREMGKPLKYGIGEVTFCGKTLPGKAHAVAAALQPQKTEADGLETVVHYDPYGVCGVITPWNYPMSMPQWMVVPALVAGNGVVLKPSEETPLIGQAYADVLGEVLPEGVLRVIHGGDAQGKALVEADVQLIAFTGSRAAGVHIMGSAAGSLKRLVLELGGKDPMLVLDDADVDAAASVAVENSFENSGQMCVSIERIYVHEAVADAFEAKVAELSSKLEIGAWDDDRAELGPMINDRQRDHVIAQIRDAVEKGARVLCGDTEHPPAFVRPTVLADVTDAMAIMQEETFGPVACIARFDDLDDAVERANAGIYGLGATVFGSDETRAYEVARRLDAGMVGVNKSCFPPGDAPWVGAKQSGYGFHGSPAGHRQFAQCRVLSRPRPTE
ncbi:MAG: aldehyde dehydrogenase family protein [Gammaproteobacteria bacterium]|nr:aldehyde dehydrogenase family protein [Gammaproteobacteria bacterium]